MVTSGFFNSINHDRRYDALQFGSIFDGIVKDGIFMSIGTCFRVIPAEDMMLLVGIGRAWFDHTWTLNDAPLPIYIPQSEVILDRIDAVVLDVNQEQTVRDNSIVVVKGTPSKTPQRPTLIKSKYRNQYPLAYVSVRAGVTSIRAADITSAIGTSETPYVTGILDTVDIDALKAQWEDQWREFFENQTNDMIRTNDGWKAEWRKLFDAQNKELDDTVRYWKDLWDEWFYSYVNRSQNGLNIWIGDTEEKIYDWWDHIKGILDENCCSNLADRIVAMEEKVSDLEGFRDSVVNKREIPEVIYDTRYDSVLGILTTHEDIALTTDQGETFSVIGEGHEPILDFKREPIGGALKIAIL